MADGKALQAVGLSHSYAVDRAERPVLRGVDLDVAAGEAVCVVGHSGTGKSTFLRCLAGLLQPSAGVVRVGGHQVVEPPPDLAVVFQDYSRSLMPWMSILDNVMLPLRRGLPARERRERAEAALESVGLAGTESLYPWQVSGGMQQRVAIARALAYRPGVLLMDEPFASVDAQTRADLEDMVLRIRRETGITLIVVTHDIDEAVYLADRVVVLAGKPASITADLPVDLPGERDQLTTKADERFLAVRGQVLKMIRTELSTTEGVA
ncbi:ABC transporter ATP-binding protein [Streptomyces sp. NPDC002643]